MGLVVGLLGRAPAINTAVKKILSQISDRLGKPTSMSLVHLAPGFNI